MLRWIAVSKWFEAQRAIYAGEWVQRSVQTAERLFVISMPTPASFAFECSATVVCTST